MESRMLSLVVLVLVLATSAVRPETAPSGALQQQLRAIVQPVSDELGSSSASGDTARIGLGDESWTGLGEALELFSPAELRRNWRAAEADEAGEQARMRDSIGTECRRHVERYLNALHDRELWALKMDDATGRYSSGFYWGNSYYTGSATECEHIGLGVTTGATSLSSSSKPSSNRDELTQPKFNVGQQREQQQTQRMAHLAKFVDDKPPYPLGFFMIRIAVNGSFTPVTRLVHVGACLPFSCYGPDVALLARMAASAEVASHSFVSRVRDQHNYYDMYADPVFWILFNTSAVVLFLLIAGTSYDVYLTRKFVRKQRVTYDLEKHVKLERFAKDASSKLHNGNGVSVTEPIVAPSVPINNNNDHEGSLRTPTPELLKLNAAQELLLSFSVRANMRVICDREVGRDTLSTVHGLRALSMAWVILGHTCIIVFKYSDNMEYRKVVERRFLFQTIQNGAFSVDTFFFMGGLLVSFLYFRTNAKGDLNRLTQGTRGFLEGLLKFLGFLGYRFCRLTAPYMYVLGLTLVSMKWFEANSVFEPPTQDHVNCPNYWWRNLLYVNTLFPVEQMCMLWSWYVADDTQFYVVGALILIVATNHLRLAALALVSLVLASWLTTGYIALVNNHMPNTDDPLALFDKIYDKPWTRAGPYLIGMAVGYFLFKTDRKIKLSKAAVSVGWFLTSACVLSLLFGLYETELSPWAGAAYSALSHSAWALALAWVVIACSTGYGGYVNDILSAPVLYPFSRVTYCAYLVHPLIIRMTAMNMDSPLHLAKGNMVIMYFGQVVASYILSFVISLAFEAPVVSMLKILSPNKRNRLQ